MEHVEQTNKSMSGCQDNKYFKMLDKFATQYGLIVRYNLQASNFRNISVRHSSVIDKVAVT